MTETWEQFDVYVEEAVANSNVEYGLLPAHLTVLLLKGIVTYQTKVDEVQRVLNERYHVNYNPSDIDFEMKLLINQEQKQDTYVLETEDYYEGF